MAYLWLETNGAWAAARLDLGCYEVGGPGDPPVRRASEAPGARGGARLLGKRLPTGHEQWLVMAAARGLRINGDPVWLGLRFLKDRDEIRLPTGERLYFSSERLAQIVPMPSGMPPVHCPRCHNLIQPGDAAVLCPGCQTWHHQTEALPCWRYDERCALCPQATDLNADLNWTPERL